jgi:hypothetical protein
VRELEGMISLPPEGWAGYLRESSVLREKLEQIEHMGRERYHVDAIVGDDQNVLKEVEKSEDIRQEYLRSAAEFIVNLCVTRKWIYLQDVDDVFIPREVSWGQKGAWK